MLETKIKILEDRPDRIVISQSLRPWQWGGPGIGGMLLSPILLPLIWIAIARKIICDKVYQNVVINRRFLFVQRRRQVPFSEVSSIKITPRQVVRVVGGGPSHGGAGTMSTPVTIDLDELSLLLSDNTELNIITAYRGDEELRASGKKLSELMEKPLSLSNENR